MEYEGTENITTLNISPNELWYLAKFFAPGLIFGVEDPTIGYSDDEISEIEAQAYTSLNNKGMIDISQNGQVQIDEFLGAMVYLCIHSKDIFIINNKINNQEIYYHFLPKWRLKLIKQDDEYELTFFQDNNLIIDNIVEQLNPFPSNPTKSFEFFISVRDLELVSHLFTSGEGEKAIKILKESVAGETPDLINFLTGYQKPKLHYCIDILFDRHDEELILNTRCELFVIGKDTYWFTHWPSPEDRTKMVFIRTMSSTDVKDQLNELLPY